MRALFARGREVVLDRLAAANLLVAFDYDGTLAPIVADRDRAALRPRTARLLARVADRYPTAVVSGRACADVAARVRGLGVRYLSGNHGLEPGPAPALARFEADAGQARVLLEQALAELAGVDVEDKRYSLALHYRRARRRPAARATIAAAVAALPMAMRVVHGKQVVNAIPAAAPDKGDAVLGLRAAAGADVALYVGDDVTDEDVFVIDQPGRLLTIRIGLAQRSAATYGLRDQRELDRLLAALVALR